MRGENALVRFLYDHPWTSQPILESVFGPGFKQLIKRKETRSVVIPGVGECWGGKHEKLSSIPGVRRRELAKRYLIEQYGKDALWIGGAPGLRGSDLIALVGKEQKYWVRIWVDQGSAAVEALPFVHRGLDWERQNFVELVITQSLLRAELIKRQVASRWKYGKDRLLIYAQDADQYLRIHEYRGTQALSPGFKRANQEQVLAELAGQRWERLENLRHDQNIGKLFLSLRETDFDLLNFVGNNPHFAIKDLAYLLSYGTSGSLAAAADPLKKMDLANSRLDRLKGLELIESAAAPLAGLKVSAKGLEVLAKYWGVSPERMRRFHAWPQVKNKAGEVVYSENALSSIKDHTRSVQQFIFGLFDSAWRVQKSYGGADLFVDTIVGKRIYFEDLATRDLDWLIPDAVIDLSFWRRTWRDGKVHEPKIAFATARLLVEIDRATNPITRLHDRIQKYGRIWCQLSGNPVQVWVIEGSPWREKEILQMMETAGIPGWTVLAERLYLTQDDPWWEGNLPPYGVLPYRKHRGAAPLRKVWRKTGDHKLHHLLDHAPWTQKMSLSKPMVPVPRGY